MEGLELVAASEGALAAAMVAVVAGRFGIVQQRGRRDARRRDDALPLLVAATLGGGEFERAATVLARSPVRQQVDLIDDLNRTLAGTQRERLTDVAASAGLVRRAEGWCASRRWWRRLRGARVLTLLHAGESTVPALLTDPHPEVRAQAAAWAAEWPRPDIIERLLDMLGDEETLCRFTVKDSLLRLGRPVVEPLARRLWTLDGFPLDEALTVAAGLAEPRFLGFALAASRHPRAQVRALAIGVVGRVGGAPAAERALTLLDDDEAAVRAAATEALGGLGHWPAAPALAARLRDEAWDVRRAAGIALRSLGAPGVLQLRRALSDDDRFAADMARHILDYPAEAPPVEPR